MFIDRVGLVVLACDRLNMRFYSLALRAVDVKQAQGVWAFFSPSSVAGECCIKTPPGACGFRGSKASLFFTLSVVFTVLGQRRCRYWLLPECGTGEACHGVCPPARLHLPDTLVSFLAQSLGDARYLAGVVPVGGADHRDDSCDVWSPAL